MFNNIFYENDSEGKWVMDWASGNTGFALTGAGTEDPASISDFILCGRKGGQMRKVGNKVDWGFRFEVGYAYCCR